MNISEIKKILPHRYPFLLIDKVIEINTAERSIVVQKNVTANEEFFNGHFSELPIMPGVLIVEAMAQATAILAMQVMKEFLNSDAKKIEKIMVLAGVDKARFKQPVIPGDVLIIEAKIIKEKSGICKSQCVAKVDDQIRCTAEILALNKEV